MGEPTGVNVRCRYLGEYEEGEKTAPPGSVGVNVRTRLIDAFVDQAEPPAPARPESLRSFVVYFYKEPTWAVCGHGVRRCPGSPAVPNGPDDFLKIFRVEDGKEVVVAQFNARMVREVVETDAPPSQGG